MPEERREQVTRVVIEQSQRLTGGTRWSRWKAAASNGWHEPDKSRGLCPESVSGSGCKPPGRLGRRWSLIMRLVAWCFDRAPETPPQNQVAQKFWPITMDFPIGTRRMETSHADFTL